ncbi:DUF6986 family protein [Virgisporangium aurantiacum]|uniref:Uncharacterized protein n=1 Tax=Virgisporangium aurantiacum TaxID=175570 RepID=A0A8J3ZJW2_9ACTN|nr:hypothetical protein Vau01_103290 [Virgisporangium aurantiacum]
MSDEPDRLLAPVGSALAAIYPGQPRRRQPVHTVYAPADRVVPGLATVRGREARQALSRILRRLSTRIFCPGCTPSSSVSRAR